MQHCSAVDFAISVFIIWGSWGFDSGHCQMDPFDNGGFPYLLSCLQNSYNILQHCNIMQHCATFREKMFSMVLWPCESISGIIWPMSLMHFNLCAVMCVPALCRKYLWWGWPDVQRHGDPVMQETDSRGQKTSKKLFMRCHKLLHNVAMLHDAGP